MSGEARFTVVVKVDGRDPSTETVEAPRRGDGFEGPARTRAMMAYLRRCEAQGMAGLRGQRVEYEVSEAWGAEC